MPPSPTSSIAIIGASLTGLSFTLALLQHSLYSPANIKIYDLRNPDVPDPANSSGVVLTPNGLSILDSLGVLSRVRHLCWLSEYRTFKNDQDETVRKFLIANESLYGYKNHRLWRKLLLDALLTAVEERRVRIQWEAKFEGVRRESADHVTFVVNGREEMAGMLIGAAGIYSAVRRDLDPEVGPEYTGVAGALSHIRRDEVTWPYEGYEKACTIQGKPGALVLMPEDRAGGVIMVAKQVRMEERSREQWDEFAHDKEQLCEFYRDRYEEWGETAKSIIDAVCRNPDTLYMWPFMKMGEVTTMVLGTRPGGHHRRRSARFAAQLRARGQPGFGRRVLIDETAQIHHGLDSRP